ncbi:MAG: hypothetical protein AB1633_07205, partial [Elusimicrobiota bacterium]
MKRVFFLHIWILLIFSISETKDSIFITPIKGLAESQPVEVKKQKLPEKFTRIKPGIFTDNFTPDESPYLLEGSIIIPSGTVVNISPGVEIYVGGSYSTIMVFGSLIAIGTKEEPINIKSAKETPQPWDWDRIYFRSPNRSFLEYINIKHSNYGFYLVNGSVELKECILEQISINAIYVRNSTLSLKNINIMSGCVNGIFVDIGGQVDGDSAVIRGCVNGLLCDEFSFAKIKRLDLQDNEKGIVIKKNSKIVLEDAFVVSNRIGIMMQEMPKTTPANVKGNDINFLVGMAEDFSQAFKPPELVRTLGLSNEVKFNKEKFSPEMVSQKSPKAKVVHLVGSLTSGFAFHGVDNLNGIEALENSEGDTIKKQYPQSGYISGLRPEFQFFANSQQRDIDLTINADFYNDPQVHYTRLKKNFLNIDMQWKGHRFTIGDFTEKISEISMFSRKMLGTRLDFGIDQGKESMYRFIAGIGETQIPYDSGQIKPDILGSDSLPLVERQEFAWFAEFQGQLRNDFSLGLYYIGSKSPYEPVYIPYMREIREYTGSQFSRDPISGRLIGGRAEWDVSQYLAICGEANLGIPDTLDNSGSSRNLKHRMLHEIAMSLEAKNKYGGFNNLLRGTYVAPHYFSGGNPTLTRDMFKIEAETNSDVLKDMPWFFTYILSRENLSAKYFIKSQTGDSIYDPDSCQTQGPITRQRATTGVKYTWKEFDFGVNYDFSLEHNRANYSYKDTLSNDSTVYFFTEMKMRNMPSLDFKHNVNQRIYYSLGYKFLHVNDMNNNPFASNGKYIYQDLDDALKQQFKLGFKIKPVSRVKNQFNVKYTYWIREKNNNILDY